jgi:predicted nucleotidyltransferase
MKIGRPHAIGARREHQATMSVKPSQALHTHRVSIRRVVAAHRAHNPRVFGSVARGEDAEQSDLDILVETTGVTSLFDIADIELELEQLMGISVHVTTFGALRGELRDRVLAEALAV